MIPRRLWPLWERLKVVMAPGALDPLVKEMIYVAVSTANGCQYCIHSHTAAEGEGDEPRDACGAAGGDRDGDADQRLGDGLGVEPDEVFKA
jgi:AhpD family alkylhydroperoxidase